MKFDEELTPESKEKTALMLREQQREFDLKKRAQDAARKSAKEDAPRIDGEYKLAANILLNVSQAHNGNRYETGDLTVNEKKLVKEYYMKDYLQALSTDKNIMNKGFNNEVLSVFKDKDNMSELINNKALHAERTPWDTYNNVKFGDDPNKDIKFSGKGWKQLADLVGDNKLGHYFQEKYEKSKQKGFNELASRLDKIKDGKEGAGFDKITATLKAAGITRGGSTDSTQYISSDKRHQNKDHGK